MASASPPELAARLCLHTQIYLPARATDAHIVRTRSAWTATKAAEAAATATTTTAITAATATATTRVADHLVQLGRDLLIGLAQNADKLARGLGVLRREECDRRALAASTAGTTDLVNVVLGICREIVVDH